MYSIKRTQDIEFNYNTSSIRKITDTEYQFHGKPNAPNLVLMNGLKRISYVAERIEIKPGNQSELIIHHYATSNFPKKAVVIFPLVVSNNVNGEIDRLLGMKMNETLDLDIGSEINDFTLEINEAQKSAYLIRMSSGLPIAKSISKGNRKKEPIIEGACGLSGADKKKLSLFEKHIKLKSSNPHGHKISQADFERALNTYKDTYGSTGIGDLNAGGETALDSKLQDLLSNLKNGTGEMECFPNEGLVFNKKFHIICDVSNSADFIYDAERFQTSIGDTKNDSFKTEINNKVAQLREHIKQLGGIDTNVDIKYKDGDIHKYSEGVYNYINAVDNTNSGAKAFAISFFKKNPDIDIVIGYCGGTASGDGDYTTPGVREIGENGDNMGQVTKKKQLDNAIFVAVRSSSSISDEDIAQQQLTNEQKVELGGSSTDLPEGDNDYGGHALMNAKKFSTDYLNKDFNRYTHISIPGYMTNTENQSMKAIMTVLGVIFGSSIAYYTVPEFYKIAVRKITMNSRQCDDANGIPYANHFLVSGFNFAFILGMVIIPSIIMATTGNTNGVLCTIVTIGVICYVAIKARYKFDRMFFRRFYPGSGLIDCDSTKDYAITYGVSGYFTILSYMPRAITALLKH